MPPKTKTSEQKKQEETYHRDRAINLALKLYEEMPEGARSFRKAAAAAAAAQYAQWSDGAAVKVAHNTVQTRWTGATQSRHAAADDMSLLDTSETENVLNFLVEMADHGTPLTHDMLRDLIMSILQTHPTSQRHPNNNDDNGEPVLGKNWTYRFISKHSDRVKVYLSSPLDSKRARAVNPNTDAAWFEMLGKILHKYKIDNDCLYGCDETGFQIGMVHRQYVIGGAGKKQQYKQKESDSRETITAVVTICADGTSISPLVIFKGKAFSVKWAENNPLKALCISISLKSFS
jgi:hypothetical protein